MSTVDATSRLDNRYFQSIISPFLKPGLPFADVLSAEDIREAFQDQDGLFGQNDIFSTPVVLWAFLSQVLQDGKGAACAAAVAQIATYCTQMDLPSPCGDTGDYCRARAKLNTTALRHLVGQTAGKLQQQADPSWLWHGLHAKLVDGFTFTMMDTPQNQEQFPQTSSQLPGVGFPMARACAILSLSTATIQDVAIGPCKGKETGETALLRSMMDGLDENDVVVFDRYYCSYMMLALLAKRGIHVCTRLHQRRKYDLRKGKRLGHGDRLVTWERPARPQWMSEDLYAQIPETLTVRELQFTVTEPGRRAKTITVVTTLLDPDLYPKEDLADLFGYRWNVELDIRQIKQALHLSHVCCKSPDMVLRHLLVTLLAYNLIRTLLAAAAAEHGCQPRQLGFTFACQMVLSWWQLLSTGTCRNPDRLWKQTLQQIAANKVANRPGRVEPRVLKRRVGKYPLMKAPRQQLQAELLRGITPAKKR